VDGGAKPHHDGIESRTLHRRELCLSRYYRAILWLEARSSVC
jgi:hypothetical protein